MWEPGGAGQGKVLWPAQVQAAARYCPSRELGRHGVGRTPHRPPPHLPRLKGKTSPSANAPATSTSTAGRLLKCRQQATSTASAAKRKASGPLPGTLHRYIGRQAQGGGGGQSKAHDRAQAILRSQANWAIPTPAEVVG